MIKNKIVSLILFIVVFLLIWNALDYLYSVVITNNAFHFAAGLDLIVPLVVSAVIGTLLFLRDKKD